MKVAIFSDSIKILNDETNNLIKNEDISHELIFEFDVTEIENHKLITNQFLVEDFFGGKKAIILTGIELVKAKNEKIIFLFLEKLLERDSDNLLIIKIKEDKSKVINFFDKNKNIKFQKVESIKNKKLIDYVTEKINFDKNIDPKKRNEISKKIIKLSNNNFDLITNEIKKYEIFKEEITENIVLENTYDVAGETIFKFIDDLISLDFKKIKLGINSMKSKAISITFILEMLVNEFALLALVYNNEKYNLNIEDKYIHKAPFKVSKAKRDVKKINSKILFKFYELFIENLVLSKTNSKIDLYEVITYKIYLIINS